MKEASGEANMTVITILLIAVVGAAGTLIINNLMKQGKLRSCCADVGGEWKNGTCSDSSYQSYCATLKGESTVTGSAKTEGE